MELSSAYVGCVYNISYAEDILLLGPTIGGLRKLVSICEAYAEEHGLKYNSKTSELLVFKGKTDL